ncbi:MAG: M20/M25/M40 family metallo-hydrolase, partial [Candidatus Roizmanbacteria bacterium]
DFIKKELINLGCQVDLYQKNNCPPLIIGKKIISPKAKNLGIYAHYDVQPEDPVGEWKTPPFKLTVKNGKIYGRGTADDKGHLIQILTAAKKLRNNIVFIFEGEEEVGSINFEELIKKDPFLKKIDVFYVFDMGMKDKNTPQIFYGLRGVITFELRIKTNEADLHSGVYGNRVLNPAQLLAELMSKMKNSKTRQIKIPDFYNQIRETTREEKDLLLKSNVTLLSKIYPALDINGMISGYTGEGSKTIIPASAMVKFSIRLVPNQDHKKIELLVEKFVRDNLPKGVRYKFEVSTGSDAFYTDFKNIYTQKTAKIFEEVFNSKTLFNRSGGSVAAAEILKRLFKKPVILIGFTLPDDNIHAPNENFNEETFFKGIVAIGKIFAQ